MAEMHALDLNLENALCSLCGPSHVEPVVSAKDYETPYSNTFCVVRCKECGLVFSSPRPSMVDLFKYFYGEDYVCYKSAGMADRVRTSYLCKARFKQLKKIMPRGGRFLDVGCSYGYFLQYLQDKTDWEPYGCEPNRAMAQIAISRGLDVRPEYLAGAGYRDDSFDMVYMSHVLEHVPDLVETVQEVFRILKPGGVFLTETPDFDSPMRERFGPCWWGYHLPRHLTHFTHDSITGLLSKVGLEVEKIKPCFRPGPMAWSVQNLMKEKKMPVVLSSFFGMQNPFFVASLSPLAAWFLVNGHSEMMETLARKPTHSRPLP